MCARTVVARGSRRDAEELSTLPECGAVERCREAGPSAPTTLPDTVGDAPARASSTRRTSLPGAEHDRRLGLAPRQASASVTSNARSYLNMFLLDLFTLLRMNHTPTAAVTHAAAGSAWARFVRPAAYCAICLNDDRPVLVLGRCGHLTCVHCLTESFGVSAGEFLASGGIPSSAYIAPPQKCTMAPGVHCSLCFESSSELSDWSLQYWDSVRVRAPRPIPATSSSASIDSDPFLASLSSPVGLIHPSVFSAIQEWTAGDLFARNALGPVPAGVEVKPIHDIALRAAEDAVNLAMLSQPPAPAESPLFRAPSEVAPARCTCGALLAVDAHAIRGAGGQGVHVTCFECGGGLCAACGLVWDVMDVSHTGVACIDVSLLRANNEEKIKDFSSDTKICPNPDCRIPIFHKFGHACHSVTCKRCSWTFCYVCLLTGDEKTSANHAVCPSTCNAACDCAPCLDCIPRNCDECKGSSAGDGCITCRLGHRPETVDETLTRLGRHAAAVAERKTRCPQWPGPRRFRPATDRPVASNVTRAIALPFTRGTLTSLVGAAALAREGLQLLIHAAKELGLYGATFVTVVDAAGRESRHRISDVVAVKAPDGSAVVDGALASGHREEHVVVKPHTPPLMLAKGMRVRRSALWLYGSQDEAPGPDGVPVRVHGTVTRVRDSGDDDVIVRWDAPRGDDNSYAQRFLEVVLSPEFPLVGSVVRSSAGASLTGVLADKGATATVVADRNMFIGAPPQLMCMFDEALKVLQYSFAAEHDAAVAGGARSAGAAFADGVPSLRSQLRPTSPWLAIAPKLTFGNDCTRSAEVPSFMDTLLKIIRVACEHGEGARHDVALIALTALARALEMPAETVSDDGTWDATTRLRAERRASMALELLSLEGLEMLADVFALGRDGEAEAAYGAQATFAEDGFSYRFFLSPGRRLALHEIDIGGGADGNLPVDRILHVTDLLLRGDGKTLVVSVDGDPELRELFLSREDVVEHIAVIADLAAKATPPVAIGGIAKKVVAGATVKAAQVASASRPSGKRRLGTVGAGRLAVVANAIVDSIANDLDVLDALFSWGVRHAGAENAAFTTRRQAVIESLWTSARARVPGAANLAVLWAATVAPPSTLQNSAELILGPWAHLDLHFGERPIPLTTFTNPELFAAARVLFEAPPKGSGREQLLSLEIVDALEKDASAPSPTPAAASNRNGGFSDDDAIAFAISASMSGDETLHSHHVFCCACKRATCALAYGPRDDFFAQAAPPPTDLSAQRARLRGALEAVMGNPALHAHTELVRRAAFRCSTGLRSHTGSFRTNENRGGFSCSLVGSGDETGPLCRHGRDIIGNEHWSCCGQTVFDCECSN